jgi:polysaccharide biosynthesis/export protein
MAGRPRGRWLAEVGILVVTLAGGAGCHTSPLTSACTPAPPVVRMASPDPTPAAQGPAPILGPHAVLQWNVESTKDKQAPPVEGKSVVGEDGRVDLGPYGSLAVAGLTPQQASDAIMRHMAQYLRAPHVHLTVTAPAVVMGSPRPLTANRVQGFNQTPQRNVVKPAGFKEGGPEIGDPAFVAPPPRFLPSAPPPLAGAPVKAADKPGDKPDDKDKPKDNGTGAEAAPAAPFFPGTGADLHPVHDGPAPYELVKNPLPPYVIEPPDILLIEVAGNVLKQQPVAGQFLVRPDGTVNLGIYGSVYVLGMTIDQAKGVIARYLSQVGEKERIDVNQVNLDVVAYNSKWYYVITDGAGNGQQVTRLPITGNETVLDAISLINGLSPVSSQKKIWVARRVGDHSPNNILPVDWCGITQRGETVTNYQVLPGDRIYIHSQCLVIFDNALAKFLSPAERVLGATLLGSSTVNSIRSGRTSGLGNGLGGLGTIR